MNSKLTRTALLLMFLCCSAAKICAQAEPKRVTPASPTPSATANDTQDADELKTQQQMIAELKFLRAENKGLKAEREANQGTIATQARLIQIEVERGDFFKTAAEKGIKIGGNDIVLQQKYEQMIGEYKDENTRLRSENDRLRSAGNWKALFSGVGGAGIGYLAGSRSCR